MLLIVVILLVAFILVPIIEIGLAERFRTPVKLVLYILTAIYEFYACFTHRGLM